MQYYVIACLDVDSFSDYERYDADDDDDDGGGGDGRCDDDEDDDDDYNYNDDDDYDYDYDNDNDNDKTLFDKNTYELPSFQLPHIVKQTKIHTKN